MRLRNVKNKEEILNNSPLVSKDYLNYTGHFKDLFANNNPIYLEIGMGRGKFINNMALNNPNINFIGMEKNASIITKALKEIDVNTPNLKIINANALEIDSIFAKEIDRLYLNFSDPWPKERHKLRRLTSPIFLEKYNKIFKNTKIIYLRTDNLNLFNYSIECLQAADYRLTISYDLHKDCDITITTEYEDKFSGLGMPIYGLIAVK